MEKISILVIYRKAILYNLLVDFAYNYSPLTYYFNGEILYNLKCPSVYIYHMKEPLEVLL